MPIDTEGDPIDFSIPFEYRSHDRDILGSFKTEPMANMHLKMIKAYKNKKMEVSQN